MSGLFKEHVEEGPTEVNGGSGKPGGPGGQGRASSVGPCRKVGRESFPARRWKSAQSKIGCRRGLAWGETKEWRTPLLAGVFP